MIERYKEAVLTRDLPEKGLKAGDVGHVVEVYENEAGEAGYSLEFFSPSGETVAVATVAAEAVRPAGDDEVLHARRLEESAAG